MKQRLLAITLSVGLIATLLAGCSSSSDNQGTSSPDSSASTSDSATVPSISDATQGDSAPDQSQALKIAIVSSPSGVDDGSFNQDNYNGILAFMQNSQESTVSPVVEPTGDPAASVQTVADIVADYDVIVCCGFQFAGIGIIAIDNPDTNFILVDSYPVDSTGAEVELTNVYAMTFAEQESGFFAGMAAALESTTQKVAVANGIAYPSNVNYQYGFESGVHYANAHYDTAVELVALESYSGTDVTNTNVGGNYIGSFSDESAGKVVGQALIDAGCDIIFVAAGNAGNGIFTAAKETSGVMVIGCDVDQFDDGVNGSENIMLTSAVKVMHANVEEQLTAIATGTFSGGNHLRMADTGSTGYISQAGRHQMSESTVIALEEAYALMEAGSIVPAANFNGVVPADFIG